MVHFGIFLKYFDFFKWFYVTTHILYYKGIAQFARLNWKETSTIAKIVMCVSENSIIIALGLGNVLEQETLASSTFS